MALVIALSFVVMLTVVVLALTVSMRLDRPAAKSYLDKVRANQFAQMGVDTVVATFKKETGDITGSGTAGSTNGNGRNWITQPGQLVSGGSNAADALDLTVNPPIPLHSGAATNSAEGTNAWLNPPNLNISTFRDPDKHLISEQMDASGSGTDADPVIKMLVKWIYVRQDGTIDTAENPSVNMSNPIVGRYAYWTDDESSKVNYNIAWGRTPANLHPAGHLSKIDLTALTNKPAMDTNMAQEIRSYILNGPDGAGGSLMPPDNANTNNPPQYYFFNTPKDARRVTDAAAALEASKFDVTHYNHDPDTTFFNEPRIVLTTRPDRAGWTYKNGQWVGKNGLPGKDGRPYYIRILANEGTENNPLKIPAVGSNLDPGTIATTRLDPVKINETMQFLVNYMSKDKWPLVSNPALTFQEKYYGQYPAAYKNKRIAQLALNIIDYVRSKESPADLVEPLRLSESGGSYTTGQTFGTFAYIGQTRSPKITEIGYWQSKDNKSARWKVELFLPRNYGIPSIPVTNLHLIYMYKAGSQNFANITVAEADNKTEIKAGEYVLITRAQSSNIPTPRPEYQDVRVTVAAAGSGSGGSRFNLCPLVAEGSSYPARNSYIHYKLDPPYDPAVPGTGPNENEITSVEVDDPRLNMEPRNWIQKQPWAAGGINNTFKSVNSISALRPEGASPTITGKQAPEQDTGTDGKISTASFYMPPPAGKKYTLDSGVVDDNTLGMVTSAGELGFIHTGIESSYQDLVTGATVPTGVPWRTMRLQPSQQGNSQIPDWGFMDLFTAPVLPLTGGEYVYAPGYGSENRDKTVGGRVNLNGSPALFTNMTRTAPLEAVLKNARVSSKSLATVSDVKGLAENIYNRVWVNPSKTFGYTNGFDSPGEVVEIQGIAQGGEESEQLAREIGNLFTTRGNVFTVYSIGQALKQTPTGKMIVNGEQRLQAMIERIEKTDDKGNRSVDFAPVYFRNLTP